MSKIKASLGPGPITLVSASRHIFSVPSSPKPFLPLLTRTLVTLGSGPSLLQYDFVLTSYIFKNSIFNKVTG